MSFYKRHAARTCPVCKADEPHFLYRQNFAGISNSAFLEGYDIVICKACGFGYADHIPDQAAFEEHYRRLSKYEYQGSEGQVSALDLARFDCIIDKLTPHLPDRHARILDIGCATGALLSLLKSRGYMNLIGIDPSAACAKTAHDLYGIRVYNVSAAQLPAYEDRFACIILSGVLEHIRDLTDILDSVNDLLDDDSFIFIEVPDASRFALRPDAPYQEFSLEHINFFSPTSLNNLMHFHGYALVWTREHYCDQTSSTRMPIISALFKKEPLKDTSLFTFDTSTRAGLESYITKSKSIELRICQVIDRLADEQIPLFVWGVGTHTLRLLKTSHLDKVNIVAFIDSNPHYQNKHLNNIPIIPPSGIKGRPEAILISSRVFQNEIEYQIVHELKLENTIIKIYTDL